MNRQLLALSSVLLLFGCARAQISKDNLSDVKVDTAQHSSSDKIANATNAGPGEKFDPVEDEFISKETLKAWRKALSHDEQEGLSDSDWKAARAKDEEESMASLKQLAEGHPNSSYIKTMMGQVKQHFGKKEEAAAYYEEALLQNRKDPVLIFKAAEMRRSSGNLKQAMLYYNQVLKIQPDFPGAELGVAKCKLADASSAADGKKMLETILENHPDDEKAKAALDELESGKPSTSK